MKPSLRTFALAISSLMALSSSAFAVGAIEGTVRGPDGKPMAKADIKLETLAGKLPAQVVKTDGAGRYRFSNVADASYRVTVMNGNQILGFIEGVRPATPAAKRVEFDIRKAAAGQTAKKAKHLVWVPSATGSHMGGKWVEDGDDANSDNVKKVNGNEIKKYQQDFRRPDGGG